MATEHVKPPRWGYKHIHDGLDTHLEGAFHVSGQQAARHVVGGGA